MNDHFPPKPTLPGARFSYDRNMREASRRGRQNASAFNRISDTTAGVFVNYVPPTKRAPRTGTFRGEWDATFETAYSPQDMVKISSGLEAGLYIAVESIPAADTTKEPWGNNGWVLIARLNDQSSWV